VRLSPVGSNSNPALVELFIVVRRDGFVPIARRVGAREAELGAGKFTFACDQEKIGYRGDEIRGWLVRAVRDWPSRWLRRLIRSIRRDCEKPSFAL
jgi:hypothetical protein